MIRSFADKTPQIGKGAFVADTALVLGDVHLGEHASIWYGTVVRGDVNYVRIGRSTNIQDSCVVHVSSRSHPTIIGDFVTVGHASVIHGCTIADNCLVGVGSIVLDGAEVGEGCIIAAGSLVPPGKRIEAKTLVVGSPAQVKRPVLPDELEQIRKTARGYVELSRKHIDSVNSR